MSFVWVAQDLYFFANCQKKSKIKPIVGPFFYVKKNISTFWVLIITFDSMEVVGGDGMGYMHMCWY